MSWISDAWDVVSDWGSDAMDWISDNPDTAKMVLGGIAGGVDAYYAQQALDEKMRLEREKLEQEARFKERRASNSDAYNYGSHNQSITGGTGLLANPNYIR